MTRDKIGIISLLIGMLILFGVTTSFAAAGGRSTAAKGVPLYVIIEVTWDGQSSKGDWTVWGPKWAPVVGEENGGVILSSCSGCLEMNYDFTFHGKTVQFDERYVSGVSATPQVRHVVLHDFDGDGTYTGSLAAERYTWKGSGAIFYMDRVDYDLTFDENGNLVHFHYLEYEHKKLG